MTNKALIVCAAALAVGLSGGSAIAADAAAGAEVFKKKCTACHKAEEGKHGTGPSLFGVFGKKAGGTDFKRYVGLKGADFEWDEALLIEYLADPKAFVETHTANKRSSMTFKLADEQERIAVVEYMKTLK
ncbi:MAG: c-type cytochrome [Rhodospirillales bacterium]